MECWKVQVGELFLVINVKADWWPGQIWWATTPLFISRPAILGESGLLAQKVMLPWNFVFEYQCNNCKRSLINKNNLDSHKSSTHAAISYSCASMGENPTVRLWIFIIYFYNKLIVFYPCSLQFQTYNFSYNNCKTAKIFKKQKMRPSPYVKRIWRFVL